MGLYSGHRLKLLASEGKRAVYTQSAQDAIRAIVDKFGSISDSAKYYHRGNGVWSIYTIAGDRKKAAHITASKGHWKSEPWRSDLRKIDTKEGLTIKRAQVKVKKPKHNKAQKVKQSNIFARF